MTASCPLPQLRVVSVSGSDRHCSELHEEHTLCLLHSGQSRVGARWSSGRAPCLQTAAGEIMVMELGEVHRTTGVYGKVAYSVVQIAPRFVERIAAELGQTKNPRIRAANMANPELRSALGRLIAASAAGAHALSLECLLTELLHTWLRTCSEDRVPTDSVLHRGVRRSRDALRECAFSAAGPSTAPSLAELAAISGLSVARFPHAFKQWLGMPPHAYFNLARLHAARRMLEQGLKPSAVALAFGFADLPHFSRSFRRQFGLPPRAWSQLLGASSRPTSFARRAPS